MYTKIYFLFFISFSLQAQMLRLVKARSVFSRTVAKSLSIKRGFCTNIKKAKEKRLELYRHVLDKNVKKAVMHIAKEFDFSQQDWDAFQDICQMNEEIYFDSLKRSNKRVKHDSLIPLFLRRKVCDELCKHNVNPQSLHIKFLENHETKSYIALVKLEDFVPFQDTIIPTLGLSPEVNWNDELLATCYLRHEITHLTQAHVLMTNMLLPLLLTRSDQIQKIEQNMLTLKKNQEIEADLIPALNSKKHTKDMEFLYSSVAREQSEEHLSSGELLDHLYEIKKIHDED